MWLCLLHDVCCVFACRLRCVCLLRSCCLLCAVLDCCGRSVSLLVASSFLFVMMMMCVCVCVFVSGVVVVHVLACA